MAQRKRTEFCKWTSASPSPDTHCHICTNNVRALPPQLPSPQTPTLRLTFSWEQCLCVERFMWKGEVEAQGAARRRRHTTFSCSFALPEQALDSRVLENFYLIVLTFSFHRGKFFLGIIFQTILLMFKTLRPPAWKPESDTHCLSLSVCLILSLFLSTFLLCVCMCMYMCVCMSERKRAREREQERKREREMNSTYGSSYWRFLGLVEGTCSPSTKRAVVGGRPQVQGQPHLYEFQGQSNLHRESLSQK